jgi:2-(1,2-epoxy-1,2-dihydrophenyl)acetyl-CoA isomerase
MIRISDAGGVRTLTLDRPDKLNTFTQSGLRDLHHALIDCARDPGVRAVVLTGAGRGFCAGHDLTGAAGDAQPDPVAERWSSEPVWWSPEQAAARMAQDDQIVVLLRRMSKPTIASIRGPAAGSGLVYAAACDIRIASETAVLRLAFASAGRCGDPGGAYLITKLVGSARARELYLMDPKLTAAEALAMGLVTKVVPDDQLEAETTALATRFAEGPPIAYAGIKRNLNAAETASLEETLVMEGPGNAAASLSHDGKEAGRAFLEKRKPVFRGY